MSVARRSDLGPPQQGSSSSVSSSKSRAPDRISVFSRLGTKGGSSKSSGPPPESRKGKSGSKRPGSPTIDPDWTNWDEKNLDFEDESMLEKKKRLLERELARQLAEEEPPSKKSKSGHATSSSNVPKKPVPPSTVKKSRDTSGSSSSSSSSSDSDSSSSSESTSGSSSERSRQKSKGTSKKTSKKSDSPVAKTAKKKPKKIDKKSAKPTSTKAKKSSSKGSVSGSKLSRHHRESATKDKKKIRKPKKLKSSDSKKSHSPKESKQGPKSSSGGPSKPEVKSPTEVKSAAPIVRKERDKFGFYHAVPAVPSNEGTSSSKDGRSWKSKPYTSSSKKMNESRKTSSSPEGGLKKPKKGERRARSAKRSFTPERRESRPRSRSPPTRRSSPSPHGKRRSSQSKNYDGRRSGSTGRDGSRYHQQDRDNRDDVRSRGKYDRDKRPPTSVARNDSRAGRDSWEKSRDDRRTGDSKRFPEKHYRDRRSPSQVHGQSPKRSGNQSRRSKDASISGKGQYTSSGGSRPEPRVSDYREKYSAHSGRDHSPQDRSHHSESIQRERISLERSPKEHPRERYSRERSPHEKYNYRREVDRSSNRLIHDYPDRASPFERLGHFSHHKPRWEEDSMKKDYNKSSRLSSERDDYRPRKSERKSVENFSPERSLPPHLSQSPDSRKGRTTTSSQSSAREDKFDDDKEEFSDLEIGDSDEEILNKMNPVEPDDRDRTEFSKDVRRVDEEETEEGEVAGVDSRSSSRKSNHVDTDLCESKPGKTNPEALEGISDEDLDVSDEDDVKSKAKIADALGVDWSQLMRPQVFDSEADATRRETTDIRKRWSAAAIFNRIGLSKKFLGEDKFNEIVANINSKAEEEGELQLLDDVGGFHMRLTALREKRKKLFDPYAGALTAKRDLNLRRLLCNLSEAESSDLLPTFQDSDSQRKCSEMLKARITT